jgi:DNA mismatch endonuclease (patch repair protein)
MGLRYRVSARPIPGLRRTADIVFPRIRLAVFIDGCFWHGCALHYQAPARNADFWHGKRARNRERDDETDAALAVAGWHVMRVWEHQIKDSADTVAATIAEAVREQRVD